MIDLPDMYKKEMQSLLGDEYLAYETALKKPAYHGLRVNTAKISVEEFQHVFPYHLEPVKWTKDGFYYDPADPVTKHPYYYAGLYYVQEPSAMIPGEVMPVSPYDRVLDLCAAPGGKSTKLGVKLNGTGILVSNDRSVSRAQALLKNIESFGIKNAFVTAENPERLTAYFPHYFNRILVDAPCSGEGMFRRDSSLMHLWEKRDSSYYVPIQRKIMEAAVNMLADGGTIVYSTCTFSRAEDEEIIRYALSLDPYFHVVPVFPWDGFVQNELGTRLYPHRIKGEGHFVSVLQKDLYKEADIPAEKKDMYVNDGFHVSLKNGSFQNLHDRLYYVPDTNTELSGLRLMRSGLLIGEKKKQRFEYSEAFALALKADEYRQTVRFSADDPRIMKYLKGETLDLSDYTYQDGLILLCAERFPLGFARMNNGVFKNRIGHSRILH